MKATSSTTKPATTASRPTHAPPTTIDPTTGSTRTSAAAATLTWLRNGSMVAVAAPIDNTRAMRPARKRRQRGACCTLWGF